MHRRHSRAAIQDLHANRTRGATNNCLHTAVHMRTVNDNASLTGKPRRGANWHCLYLDPRLNSSLATVERVQAGQSYIFEGQGMACIDRLEQEATSLIHFAVDTNKNTCDSTPNMTPNLRRCCHCRPVKLLQEQKPRPKLNHFSHDSKGFRFLSYFVTGQLLLNL